MTRLDERGQLIADWWRDHPGEHTWAETLAKVNAENPELTSPIIDNDRGRRARTRACAIAVRRGDCVQYAVYANDCTWQYVNGSTETRVGDPVTPLIDPMLHASITEAGVAAKKRTFHEHLTKERMRGLSADERELVQLQIDYEKHKREEEERHARQMRLLIRMRNAR